MPDDNSVEISAFDTKSHDPHHRALSPRPHGHGDHKHRRPSRDRRGSKDRRSSAGSRGGSRNSSRSPSHAKSPSREESSGGRISRSGSRRTGRHSRSKHRHHNKEAHHDNSSANHAHVGHEKHSKHKTVGLTRFKSLTVGSRLLKEVNARFGEGELELSAVKLHEVVCDPDYIAGDRRDLGSPESKLRHLSSLSSSGPRHEKRVNYLLKIAIETFHTQSPQLLENLWAHYDYNGQGSLDPYELYVFAMELIERVIKMIADVQKERQPNLTDEALERIVKQESFYHLPGDQNTPTTRITGMVDWILGNCPLDPTGGITRFSFMTLWLQINQKLFTFEIAERDSSQCGSCAIL